MFAEKLNEPVTALTGQRAERRDLASSDTGAMMCAHLHSPHTGLSPDRCLCRNGKAINGREMGLQGKVVAAAAADAS